MSTSHPIACLPCIVVAATCACLRFQAAIASSAVVPDEHPTVQAAIDSGADTVLIREGTYPERPHVDHPIVLRGIGISQRPQIRGLDIYNTNFWANPPLFGASRIQFTASVHHLLSSAFPRNLQLSFSECHLAGGFDQPVSTDPDDIAILAFQGCFLAGGCHARAAQVIMEADTVHGLAEWRTHEVSVAHCVFGGAGLRLTDSPRGTVAFNRMDRCEIGLDTRDAALTIEGNVLSGCTTGMYLSGSSANVLRNDVRQCGTGIRVESIIDLNLVGNTIVGIQGHGIDCWEVVYLFADSNIVGQCVGDGMRSDSPYSYDSASIRRNTIFGNAGSGIVLLGQTVHAVVLENNIVSGNNGWGLSIGPGVGVTTRCNDWFGNGLGGVDGGTAGPSDLSMDPLFCGADSADVRLDSGSPLVDASGCGQIGALGVGCGKTATVLQMVAVVPHGRGVAVRWRFGFTAPALTWLERATGQTGPWRPVSGQPEADGETYTQVDEDAEPGISYWYRVGWQEGAGQEVGYSTPVRYTIERLSPESRVFPNPTFGPATIEWTLVATADLDVRIYDLAGREVAAPARGQFGPGKYSTRWEGLRPDGKPAPAGWYVVRLRGGMLSAAHRLLLLR